MKLLEVEGAVAAGPTGVTVWRERDGGGWELVRTDGKDLSAADVRAQERAEALMQVMAAGGQPYFACGAYAVGLEVRESLPEVLEDKMRRRAVEQIRRVPFDVRGKVVVEVLWQDVPAGEWRIIKGDGHYLVGRDAASGFGNSQEIYKGTDPYGGHILYGKHKTYKTLAGAKAAADKLNAG